MLLKTVSPNEYRNYNHTSLVCSYCLMKSPCQLSGTAFKCIISPSGFAVMNRYYSSMTSQLEGRGRGWGLRLSLVWIVKPAVSRIEEEAMSLSIFDLCIGQIKASTSPGQPPRAFDFFWKLLFKFPPTRAKMPFKYPTLGSIQVIKCPHPGDISQAHKLQKDGRNAFSCRRK